MVGVVFAVETLSGQNFPYLVVMDNGPVINLLFKYNNVCSELPAVMICCSSQHEKS